ncbi:hypothetical protein SISSUDRAFT_994749, partial [Sistotremastrum suecicum HHB10207 ss-3]
MTEGIKTRDPRDNDFPGEEPIEGGPKTAETPGDDVKTADLLKSVDFAPDLKPDERRRLEEVVTKNSSAFGLDGRLGEHDTLVNIPLKPDAKPVSLPPFPISPASREVMDKQMDKWINLGVIEPSSSPWGAPAFITYRQKK